MLYYGLSEIHLYFPITYSNKILLFCFIYERLIGTERFKLMETPIKKVTYLKKKMNQSLLVKKCIFYLFIIQL